MVKNGMWNLMFGIIYRMNLYYSNINKIVVVFFGVLFNFYEYEVLYVIIMFFGWY